MIAQAFGNNRQSGPLDVAGALRGHGGPHGHLDFETETLVVGPLAPTILGGVGNGRGKSARSGDSKDGLIVPVAFDARQQNVCISGDITGPIDTDGFSQAIAFQNRFRGDDGRGYDRPPPASSEIVGALETVKPWNVAFDLRGREGGVQFEGPHDTANIRAASGGSSRSYVAQSWAVRRLTPTECERLQGFPDGYTDGQADGPRYKQLGNSFAVNVISWIGGRIDEASKQ